jgi:alcohol dehydrogenase class IV
MNVFYKAYCRTFQKIMFVAMQFLPWRGPEQISGEGSLAKLPAFCKNKGFKHALLVTDSMIMKLGLADPLIDNMKKEGLEITVFDQVVPNPTITNIEDGLKLYKENKCDHIIALGGGSSMDCGKGIAARVARPNRSIPQMKGELKVMKKLPPLIAVPTTSGTGSEATVAAVISNPVTHEKYAMNDVSLIPHYAVMDPLLTVGLPKPITSTTGMDALTHAVEGYIGHSNTKQTKADSIEATKLIFQYLERAYNNGGDIEARNKMQIASFIAGRAFTRSYVGYVHAMAHTLGGFYGVPHGLANAIILPHVLEAYGESVYRKLVELADAVGIKGETKEEKAKAFIAEIKAMNKRMEIPEKIEGKWHIEEKDIPTMVKRAKKEANPLYPVPTIWGDEKLSEMFRKIM